MAVEREAATPWSAGRIRTGEGARLLFGRMFEDPRIELALFAPGARIFSIASAGCTAFALAAHGCRVTAVDINPAQIAYVRARMSGAGPVQGSVDRIMGFGRRLSPAMGWGRAAVTEFLMMDDPERQARYWREHLDTRRFRFVLAALLSPRRLRLFYRGDFLRGLPDAFPAIVRERLERGFSLHPNRDNPYVWRLLAGGDPPDIIDGELHRLDALHCADAATFLESLPPNSFDGFTLSNILDGVDAGYGARLLAAVRCAAGPGAIVVLRSFNEPTGEDERANAAADRAPIWGSIRAEAMA